MNRLTDFFERVAVISLPERTARRDRLRCHLAGIGLGDNLTWTEAVRGTPENLPPGWNSGPGAWGCLQSHLRALERARSDKLESILILEDDAVFSPHTSRCLPLLMSALPDDWGQFYLGGQHLTPPLRTVSPLIWRGGNINRAHAYACRGESLCDIIDHLARLEDYTGRTAGSPGWHLDHQFGSAHECGLWTAYSPSWWLAGQEADTSDISCAALRRRWWHPRRYALFLPFVHLPGSPTIADATRFYADTEESAFERCLINNAGLLAWLHRQAEQALDHGCLPAWHSPRLDPGRVAALWPAGVLPTPLDAPDYPFDGLFRHDLAAALQVAA